MDIGVAHLLEASVKLECSIETTTRALMLYHHFMRCVDDFQYDRSMVAAVSLNLSGRINEQILDVETLLCVFYSIVNKTTEVLSPDNTAFVVMKKSLILNEYLMLRMLEFNLNHRLAHQYLVPFLTFIFERSKNIAEFRFEISNTCIRFLSDFYTTPNCLNYKPEHIAIACIDLTLYMYGLINDLVMVPVWYQGFCVDVPVEPVKLIKRDMMELYRKGFLSVETKKSSEEELVEM